MLLTLFGFPIGLNLISFDTHQIKSVKKYLNGIVKVDHDQTINEIDIYQIESVQISRDIPSDICLLAEKLDEGVENYAFKRIYFYFSNCVDCFFHKTKGKMVCFFPKLPTHPLALVIDEILANYFYYYREKLKILVLHAASVKVNNEGLLFLAESGGGKTTISRCFNSKDVISDDVVVVKEENAAYFLYSPFLPLVTPNKRKPFGIGPGKKVPLKKMYFLRKSKKNRIINKSINGHLLQLFWRQVWPLNYYAKSKDIGLNVSLLHFIKQLCQRVPAYELSFRKDRTFLSLLVKQ